MQSNAELRLGSPRSRNDSVVSENRDEMSDVRDVRGLEWFVGAMVVVI